MGGLPRRNHIVERARAEGPVISLDAGLSLSKGRVTLADLPQRRAKAGVIARALALAGTDAVALGATDWALGAAEVRALVAEHGLPVLAANLVCGGERPYPASVVLERGGVRVGLVGVTDGEVDGCEVTDARAALERALGELPPVDLRVALLPVDQDGTSRLLAPPIDVDLAFDASPMRMSQVPEQVGAARVIGTGPRGQRVGVTTVTHVPGATAWRVEGDREELQRQVELARDRLQRLEARAVGADDPSRFERALEGGRARVADAEAALAAVPDVSGPAHRLAVELVELDEAVPDHAPTAALVASFLASLDAAAPGTVAEAVPRVGPAGAPWAGSDTCKGCHAAIDAQWSATPHAHAWRSLVDDGHAADRDCFACHATAVGEPGGPAAPEAVAGLRDVQCEACHGPSAAHVKDPAGAAVRPVRTPPTAVCTRCHDGERDGGRFDLPQYLPRVVHRTPRAAEAP